MNHTKVGIIAIVAVAAALIGALGVNISIQQQTAAAQNVTDIENSETNFSFKQKLKNNCSGFADCTNDALETFGAVGGSP